METIITGVNETANRQLTYPKKKKRDKKEGEKIKWV